MLKKGSIFVIAIFFFLSLSTAAIAADSLSIFWAEWDPATYLQELVLDFEEETGIKVTVETTPWGDFQTKTFREFAAKGDSWDIVVGDSQWLGAGATQGHYVDLTDWFIKKRSRQIHGACHRRRVCRVSQRQQKILGSSTGRRCERLGLSQGLVRRPQRKSCIQKEIWL